MEATANQTNEFDRTLQDVVWINSRTRQCAYHGCVGAREIKGINTCMLSKVPFSSPDIQCVISLLDSNKRRPQIEVESQGKIIKRNHFEQWIYGLRDEDIVAIKNGGVGLDWYPLSKIKWTDFELAPCALTSCPFSKGERDDRGAYYLNTCHFGRLPISNGKCLIQGILPQFLKV